MSITSQEKGVLRAVVVDDTPDIRMLLKLTLERDGDIEVVAEAGNGLDGVEAVTRLQPALVMMDLAMPVMDGLEALPLVRRACPGARVVVLSGFEAEAMEERALEAGADGYLQKGTPPSQILAYVRGLTGLTVPRAREPQPLEAAGGPRLEPFRPPPGGPAPPDAPGRAAGDGAHPGRGTPGGDPVRRLADLTPVGLVLLAGALAGRVEVAYVNEAACGLLRIASVVDQDPAVHAPPPVLVQLVERRTSELRERLTTVDRLVAPGGLVDVVLRPDGDDVLATLLEVRETDESERLRQAISTTAHEIRNPVTVLVGVAEAVDSGLRLSDDQRRHLLAAVVRQTTVLERVTEDLLTAAQAHRGSLRVDVRAVDVGPLVADAVRDLPGAPEVAIHGGEGVIALADRTRLAQMVANLLSNAVKYGRPPFAIRVDRPEGPAGPVVRIRVEDAGTGVSEGFRERLFEEFSRDEGSGARGTGLGLFVVRSLAQAQGGWADYSPREGGGSVFTITLPAAQRGRPDSV